MGSAMVLSTMTTSYRLSIVAIFSICSGLAAIFNGKFQAISGSISESVRDRVKVTITINH